MSGTDRGAGMSDVDTLTLAEFLLARIAEDVEDLETSRISDGPEWWMPDAWTRERGLAECEAKRKLVELHKPVNFTNVDIWVKDRAVCHTCHCVLDMPDGWPEDEKDWPYPVVQWSWPCPTMVALAAVYADHPDFREHWDEHAAEQSSAATRLHVSAPFRDHLPPRPAAH